MKGIKTEVKTEWKNLMHGPTRQSDGEDRYTLYAKREELPTEGNLCLAYHVKWSGGGFHPRIVTATDWRIAGRDMADTEGEMDQVYVANYSNWNTSESMPKVGFFEGKNTKAEFTNVMLNTGDKPLPYIDSDELKATGGAIVSILFIMLATSMRKEVAA